MVASSPALSNNGTDTPTSSAAAAAFNINTSPSSANPSKNLRGLNKPKCTKCGNVARSRFSYQSCKSCCAKAQNPCHIHVLKGGSNISVKITSSSSPITDHQSIDVSYFGNSHRVASLRQLLIPLHNSTICKPQFDPGNCSLERFVKVKEFRDRNIEAKNEAFDRYTRNVCLLDEVFYVNSTLAGQSEDGFSAINFDRSVDELRKYIFLAKLELQHEQ